jgi:hypothetical protein
LHSDYPFGIFKLSSLTTFGRQVGKEITKLKKKSLIRVTQLVMESSAVDLRFELRSGQTKNYETGICCFSVNHASLTW